MQVRVSEFGVTPLLRMQESFKKNELLTLEIIHRQPSGELRLRSAEGLELDVCLPNLATDWPLTRPLLLRVLANQPRLLLVLESMPQPAERMNDGLLDALVLRDNPRFSKHKPQVFELANAWRVQLLGTISYLAMRVAQDGGQYVSGSLFSAQLMSQQAPAESANIPLWLWGGPILRLWFVEEDSPKNSPAKPAPLELLLEIVLPKWGRMKLVLSQEAKTLALSLWVDELWYDELSALEYHFKAAAIRLGLRLTRFSIAGQPRPRSMPTSKAATLRAAQLPLPLFKFAAEVLVLLEAMDY
ncbi:hypothetical protein [Janthinobacterium sp. B9-8]|uniref:hypothetical protein n=1 Tax=Janthinobacterium sp. B9-8 TaxID=1236179 RepID=UPI00061D2037|nr:hypothetical protein [Janthinobacterium sp. B9-8]AMC36089.1 hypothetical protein VN23_16555 [Janthinobacterium sp. B9-8]